MTPASLSTSDWQARAARARFETRHFIDGKYVDSVAKGRFTVVNPATGAPLCEVSAGTSQDIDLAVAAAKRTFYSRVWSRMAPRDRMAVLAAFSRLIEENAERFSLLDTLCMGKPINDMMSIDVPAAAKNFAYFGELIDKRRVEPADDIITRFLNAEIDGVKLSSEDILDIAFLFLIAGLDTVSDSLTCFFAYLATHPDHRRQIVENPSLIPSAVEELLRWESPVAGGVPRMATQDVDLPSGDKISSGTAVVVNYGAANVDPSGIADPLEVRFDREVNPHLAFGAGVHRCLGSHLARRELRITLREWHRRIPDYRIKPGHEELEYPPGLRHVKDLTLAWP